MPDTTDTLNELERQITAAEDSAEADRWAQAEEVARLSAAGMSEREIAAGWVNLRTGRPYHQGHISWCLKAWEAHGGDLEPNRPTWRQAYDAASASALTRPERAQAQAPQTPELAVKLVSNLQDKPPEVAHTVTTGMLEAASPEQIAEVVKALPRATQDKVADAMTRQAPTVLITAERRKRIEDQRAAAERDLRRRQGQPAAAQPASPLAELAAEMEDLVTPTERLSAFLEVTIAIDKAHALYRKALVAAADADLPEAHKEAIREQLSAGLWQVDGWFRSYLDSDQQGWDTELQKLLNTDKDETP